MADDSSGNVYEKIIGQPLAAESPVLPPARVSAAVVLWRRREGGGPDDVDVFWVKRAESLPFMGGWHAFPGGGLSRSDAQLPVSGEPQTAADAPPAAGLPESLRGLEGLAARRRAGRAADPPHSRGAEPGRTVQGTRPPARSRRDQPRTAAPRRDAPRSPALPAPHSHPAAGGSHQCLLAGHERVRA